MSIRAGWITFAIAVAAGLVVYFLDSRLQTGVTKSKQLPTVLPPGAQQPQPQADVYLHTSDPLADPDAGTPPTPQVQTEGAYNSNLGSSSELATGLTSQQDDYSTFDDPDEVFA